MVVDNHFLCDMFCFMTCLKYHVCIHGTFRLDETTIESKVLEYRTSLVQKDAENGKQTSTYETDEYGRVV